MNVYVIYSEMNGDSVTIHSVAFSEETAKAEVMRLVADAGRARSVAELNGENAAYEVFDYKAVPVLDSHARNHVL